MQTIMKCVCNLHENKSCEKNLFSYETEVLTRIRFETEAKGRQLENGEMAREEKWPYLLS